MFTIADGRDRLYQWDSDVKLLVSEEIASGIDEAHFTAKYSRECLTVKVVHTDTESYVMVPNILLQKSYDIIVYAFCCTDKVTKHIQGIPVIAKPKPADYLYTETEILAYWTLEKRLSNLEQTGGATDDQVAAGIEVYFKRNPVNELPDVTVEDNDKILKVIDGKWTVAELSVYSGDYAVTPTVDGQTLETARKLMSDDVNVKPIPYYDVDNTSGGSTVYIGTEIEIE